jgi:solute carrier family 13 (sodium-dependent dicarboxylate transporter), member 2/3/5
LLQWTGIRFGIGVLAVMGGIAYILAGVVNWRDYQTKVDWGVVWLYAGAIIFGRVLVQTGGAYWIAQTMLKLTVPLGMGEGIWQFVRQHCRIADKWHGPACGTCHPSMAGIVHPGTSMIPFVAMSTSIAIFCLLSYRHPSQCHEPAAILSLNYRVGVILWFTNMAGLMLMASTYWVGFPGLPILNLNHLVIIFGTVLNQVISEIFQ